MSDSDVKSVSPVKPDCLDTWDEVEAELADVVITAYVTAAVLGIDLDAAARAKTAVIFTRGWRQPPPAA